MCARSEESYQDSWGGTSEKGLEESVGYSFQDEMDDQSWEHASSYWDGEEVDSKDQEMSQDEHGEEFWWDRCDRATDERSEEIGR